jgi:hypothetical protein
MLDLGKEGGAVLACEDRCTSNHAPVEALVRRVADGQYQKYVCCYQRTASSHCIGIMSAVSAHSYVLCLPCPHCTVVPLYRLLLLLRIPAGMC